jgi:hypothetical protein
MRLTLIQQEKNNSPRAAAECIHVVANAISHFRSEMIIFDEDDKMRSKSVSPP